MADSDHPQALPFDGGAWPRGSSHPHRLMQPSGSGDCVADADANGVKDRPKKGKRINNTIRNWISRDIKGRSNHLTNPPRIPIIQGYPIQRGYPMLIGKSETTPTPPSVPHDNLRFKSEDPQAIPITSYRHSHITPKVLGDSNLKAIEG